MFILVIPLRLDAKLRYGLMVVFRPVRRMLVRSKSVGDDSCCEFGAMGSENSDHL